MSSMYAENFKLAPIATKLNGLKAKSHITSLSLAEIMTNYQHKKLMLFICRDCGKRMKGSVYARIRTTEKYTKSPGRDSYARSIGSMLP